MMALIHLVLMSVMLALSLVATILIVLERDLLKAVAISAMQSTFYAIILFILMVPDVAFAYIAVTVGLYTALMVFAVKKTERFEEV